MVIDLDEASENAVEAIRNGIRKEALKNLAMERPATITHMIFSDKMSADETARVLNETRLPCEAEVIKEVFIE